jgi:hypothetical protein
MARLRCPCIILDCSPQSWLPGWWLRKFLSIPLPLNIVGVRPRFFVRVWRSKSLICEMTVHSTARPHPDHRCVLGVGVPSSCCRTVAIWIRVPPELCSYGATNLSPLVGIPPNHSGVCPLPAAALPFPLIWPWISAGSNPELPKGDETVVTRSACMVPSHSVCVTTASSAD